MRVAVKHDEGMPESQLKPSDQAVLMNKLGHSLRNSLGLIIAHTRLLQRGSHYLDKSAVLLELERLVDEHKVLLDNYAALNGL